jgi:CNT family concentrative nucleoside transporter
MEPQGLLGVAGIIGLAWALGENRRAAFSPGQRRLILAALALLFGLAVAAAKLPGIGDALGALTGIVVALDKATAAGTSFVFGHLAGGPLPYDAKAPHLTAVLAFRFLPLILVVSALSALLFHFGIMQAVVRVFAAALGRTLGLGGALGVGSAVNVFVGMVEAPILIAPYVARLARGELFALMTVGLATVAGTVMVLYATILAPVVPGALGHILIGSILNVPAALLVAALMIPFAERRTEGGFDPEKRTSSAMDAITQGTTGGVALLINVVAMLLVLVALVALANSILGLAPDVAGKPLTLERLFGWAFAPLAYAIGVPWGEAASAGQLLGTKVIINELKAYIDMAGAGGAELSPRARTILVYALCGFANLGSLGILIGGMATLVPERRPEIVALGPRSVLAGLLATCLTGAVVGLFL